MMQKIVTLILLIAPLASFAQNKNEELITWNQDKKLTWADYKGNVQKGTDAAASTATYLGIEYNFTRNGFNYKITCSFSKTRSWGLHKTEYILAHEQGHFDIAEIFARKLNKQMGEYVFNKNSFKDDLKKIYMTLTADKDSFQNQYDEETNHSINKEKQSEWLKKIEGMLKELKAFSNY
ncbi:MAG: hypothetical protein ABI675_19785 [Chitinophagaceae bacterium]